jgi:proteic killer suppression protein
MCYTFDVIISFKHKGLEKFFLTGSKAGSQAAHSGKLRLILGRLNASTNPRDMNLPGLYLHELEGDRQGVWSVKVSGNWRVTFRFDGPDATVVNYEDYH